jgi:hypothetical protein
MKLLVCLLLFCLFGNVAFAQNPPKIKKFINEIVTEPNIVYQDSANKNTLSMLQNALMNNKRHIFYKFKKDSVIYTDNTNIKIPMLRSKATAIVLDEMHSLAHYIDSTFKGHTLKSGERPIIPEQKGSRMLPMLEDSLILSDRDIAYAYKEIAKVSKHKWENGLFENSRVIPNDTITKVFADWARRGWSEMYRKGINKFYTIGMPVFLRNHTYCLFYYDYSCGGLCGYGDFAIYKKENGKWTYWGRISSWIS